MAERWTPDSWRNRPAAQMPIYPDGNLIAQVEQRLGTYPPLVVVNEVRRLKSALASVAVGDAFLLQGGDCAESFAEHSAVCGWPAWHEVPVECCRQDWQSVAART
jgi:3-deoxy-7-phosphoheptulonate synthase